MKKSIIAVGVLLLLVALFPIIGNSFMKQTINEHITELKTFGLEATKDDIDSSYLSTSRHIEFTLKDSQKFVEYLSTFSNQQPPAYVGAMLNGVHLGVDIKYSNLPFAKALEVEIFPLTLSDDIKDSLQAKDVEFLHYLQKFLQSKGIVYHINYNIVDKSFDGYIKDINQKYTLKDGAKIDIGLSKATFKGKGELVAPDRISSNIKAFHLNVLQKAQTFDLSLEKFSSSMNFNAETTHVSGVQMGAVDMKLQGTPNDDGELHIKNLTLNGSSNTQDKDAQLNTKASFDTISINAKDVNTTLKNFHFDIAVDKLDKESYIALNKLLSQKQNQQAPLANKEVQTQLVKLFSNGFVVTIAQCSLGNIAIADEDTLHGFDLQSKLTFVADKDLAKKIQLSPMMAGTDIDFNATLKVAKELYAYLMARSPVLGQVKSYAVEKNGSYIFDMQIKDAKATVNGKALK